MKMLMEMLMNMLDAYEDAYQLLPSVREKISLDAEWSQEHELTNLST